MCVVLFFFPSLGSTVWHPGCKSSTRTEDRQRVRVFSRHYPFRLASSCPPVSVFCLSIHMTLRFLRAQGCEGSEFRFSWPQMCCPTSAFPSSTAVARVASSPRQIRKAGTVFAIGCATRMPCSLRLRAPSHKDPLAFLSLRCYPVIDAVISFVWFSSPLAEKISHDILIDVTLV